MARPFPTLDIHVSVSDLFFSQLVGYSAAGKYVGRPWEHINHTQTQRCGNLGLWPRNSFSGNT
jgi:hypothetical protein